MEKGSWLAYVYIACLYPLSVCICVCSNCQPLSLNLLVKY